MTNASDSQTQIKARLAQRHRAEKRFKLYGKLALATAFAFLLILMASILLPSLGGFMQTQIKLEVTVPNQVTTEAEVRRKAGRMVKDALLKRFPIASTRVDRRSVYEMVTSTPSLAIMEAWEEAGKPWAGDSFEVWVPASDKVDMLRKGHINPDMTATDRSITDQQIAWVQQLHQEGRVRQAFNTGFFKRGDSRDPVIAGFLGSIVGSFFTLLVCILVAFPIGVMTAIYLEEFAPKNRLTDIIEVNINNLAAVPSIIYGLLGLAIYLNVMGMPRSAPLVGGLTLALMTLPVIIITTRAALGAVPDSIRMGALGLGASPLQVVLHHTFPLAMPGIMTGTILGVARAIGETAPLLMIGMVAFIVDIPNDVTDPATVMPVQIYLWASSPEMGFMEKTSAGIVVLIVVLLAMNATAIYLRKKFERRW